MDPQESPQPAKHSAAGTLLVGARRGVGRRGVVEAATCHGAEGGGLRSGAEREPLWPLAVCEVDSQPSAFDVVAALHFAQWHLEEGRVMSRAWFEKARAGVAGDAY